MECKAPRARVGGQPGSHHITGATLLVSGCLSIVIPRQYIRPHRCLPTCTNIPPSCASWYIFSWWVLAYVRNSHQSSWIPRGIISTRPYRRLLRMPPTRARVTNRCFVSLFPSLILLMSIEDYPPLNIISVETLLAYFLHSYY